MKKWMLVLVLALLAGCTTAATPWEEAGVSEEFYRVAEDFSQRFLTLDADGARYDRALETIAAYLDGTTDQVSAADTVEQTRQAIEDDLAAGETVELSEDLTAQLQAVGISAAEYALFANGRASQLQTQENRLSSLAYYLDLAEEHDDAWENLRFYLTADQAEQDSLRGYYYYGSYNYWFPWADSDERALLRATVDDQIQSYLPPEVTWYDSADDAEQRVMAYLDEVESVVALTSAHLGQAQTDLYETEQAYEELLAQIEENQRLQAQLEALRALNARLETLSAEIQSAREAGDEERLAALKEELEAIAAEYEALTAQDGG